MRLLALITWPYVRHRKLRVLLTISSIAISVALMVAMRLGGQIALSGFAQSQEQLAGEAQLQVSAGENGFPEEALAAVQDLPEVAAASPIIETTAEFAGAGQGSLLIVAVDMTGDQRMRRYELEAGSDGAVSDPLVFMAHADSIIINRSLATRAGIKLGDPLPLATAEGVKRFTVRGIIRATGFAGALRESLAVMDIYSAQKLFGRGRMFDRIDILLRNGVPVDAARRKLQAALGSAFQVERPSGWGQGIQSVTRSLALTVESTSIFALLIAAFMIYNTFSIAVAERRRQIGILRALGVSRISVLWMFLLESAAAGALGATAGFAGGRLLAILVARFLDYLMREVYGYRLPASQPAGLFEYFGFALAAGIAAGIAGALLPAWEAACAQPVQSLCKDSPPAGRALRGGSIRLAGPACLVLAILLLAAGPRPQSLFAACGLVLAGTLLLMPWLTRALISVLRPGLQFLCPVEGALAADSLLRGIRRTSITAGALMLAISLAVGVAGIGLASRQSIREWLRNGMTFDLFVTGGAGMTDRSIRFPAAFGGEMSRISGIEEVQPVRIGRVLFRDSQVMLLSTDVAALGRRIRFKTVEGNEADMVRRTAAGQGVIVSQTLSLIRHLHLGDFIELGTPSGSLRLPVTGVHVDYTDQRGALLIDRAVYVRHWKDDSVDVFRIFLKPSVPQDSARDAILRQFAGRGRMFVMTTQEVKDHILRIADQWFSLTYVQLAIALLVAVLGIFNSLTVSVMDRRRELGVLRAIGAWPFQIRRAIWLEALVIGFTGAILGLALGTVMLRFDVEFTRLDSFGYAFDMIFPAGFAAAMIPLALLAALLASIGPAESSVRGSLTEALEYE